MRIFNCNKKAKQKFIKITIGDGFNVCDIPMVLCWIIRLDYVLRRLNQISTNLTTITSKCVALCYFFVSDAGLGCGGVIGAIKGPKCGLQGHLQHL